MSNLKKKRLSEYVNFLSRNKLELNNDSNDDCFESKDIEDKSKEKLREILKTKYLSKEKSSNKYKYLNTVYPKKGISTNHLSADDITNHNIFDDYHDSSMMKGEKSFDYNNYYKYNEMKEINEYKEFKSFRKYKEYNDFKEYKQFKKF